MKVRLNAMTTTPQGLRCGVQIRGPKDSWVRFAILEIPWEAVPEDVIQEYWRWTDRDSVAESVDEPLALDWS